MTKLTDADHTGFKHYPWCEAAQNMARPRSMQLIGPKCDCKEHTESLRKWKEYLDSDEGKKAIDKVVEKLEQSNDKHTKELTPEESAVMGKALNKSVDFIDCDTTERVPPESLMVSKLTAQVHDLTMALSAALLAPCSDTKDCIGWQPKQTTAAQRKCRNCQSLHNLMQKVYSHND